MRNKESVTPHERSITTAVDACYRARREAALERYLAQEPTVWRRELSQLQPTRPGRPRHVADVASGGAVRPHQAWKRQAGFVGQGPSTSPPNNAIRQPRGGHPRRAGGGCMPPTAPPYPCPPTIDPRWWDYNRGCPIEQTRDDGLPGRRLDGTATPSSRAGSTSSVPTRWGPRGSLPGRWCRSRSPRVTPRSFAPRRSTSRRCPMPMPTWSTSRRFHPGGRRCRWCWWMRWSAGSRSYGEAGRPTWA